MLLALALAMVQRHAPVRLFHNQTASLELGWYLAHKTRTIVRGQTVWLTPPDKAYALGCTTPNAPLLKKVVGLPGELICIHERALYVAGQTEPYSVAPAQDSKGRPLRLAWDGCKTLGDGHYFVATPHPLSCDSRILGSIDASRIHGTAFKL